MSTGTTVTSLAPSTAADNPHIGYTDTAVAAAQNTAAAVVVAVAQYTEVAAEAGLPDTHHTNAAAVAAVGVVEETDTHTLPAVAAGVEAAEGTHHRHHRHHIAHTAKAGEVANVPDLVEVEEVTESTVAAGNTEIGNPVADTEADSAAAASGNQNQTSQGSHMGLQQAPKVSMSIVAEGVVEAVRTNPAAKVAGEVGTSPVVQALGEGEARRTCTGSEEVGEVRRAHIGSEGADCYTDAVEADTEKNIAMVQAAAEVAARHTLAAVVDLDSATTEGEASMRYSYSRTLSPGLPVDEVALQEVEVGEHWTPRQIASSPVLVWR
jgi:hypothetical protein